MHHTNDYKIQMNQLLDSPLIFVPILKKILWGGRRLGTLLGKPIGSGSDYAESWEIADHKNGQSIVSRPPEWAGDSITKLLKNHPEELLGTAFAGRYTQFPLLIKFLDAHQDLSIQVHPDDALARRLVNDNGKNEAWVVLYSEPGSRIYAGLKAGVTSEDLKSAMRQQSVSDLVHSFEPSVGDCIMIPAGTVHAIGAGIVIAEIQQMSDATFRVDDWGRVGPDGRVRQLHLAEALESTDFERGPVSPLKPEHVPTGSSDNTHEKLAYCQFFGIDRWKLNSSARIGFADRSRFTILIITNGKALISTPRGSTLEAHAGTTVLLPAGAGSVLVRSSSNETLQLLECHVP
jgi:mannose-6-phosphate isomerase